MLLEKQQLLQSKLFDCNAATKYVSEELIKFSESLKIHFPLNSLEGKKIFLLKSHDGSKHFDEKILTKEYLEELNREYILSHHLMYNGAELQHIYEYYSGISFDRTNEYLLIAQYENPITESLIYRKIHTYFYIEL